MISKVDELTGLLEQRSYLVVVYYQSTYKGISNAMSEAKAINNIVHRLADLFKSYGDRRPIGQIRRDIYINGKISVDPLEYDRIRATTIP